MQFRRKTFRPILAPAAAFEITAASVARVAPIFRGASSACGAAQGQLDAAIFRAALRRIIRCDRIGLTVPDRRYETWLHALRDQVLHDVLGALLRQILV